MDLSVFYLMRRSNGQSGPRELTGAVDLINHYKLLAHHEFFCKRPLPLSISETHYLHNVVGDTEIRKGEGMELDQLCQSTSLARDTNAHIQPFDMDTLREAFQLRETAPIDLPSKRKHDGSEDLTDIQRHKKSKHKSSKIDEMGSIKWEFSLKLSKFLRLVSDQTGESSKKV
ncbi:hypothetical protein HHK36_013358 [Tetracentron sinense]|uniref:Uncharacterized protein n=1 Tax=Tetracentron sinense TaxID=13715 RepID=A0A835DGD4_TETSI|nr:hypothetical protein HHK36_013358 [Tetracentron sinense]